MGASPEQLTSDRLTSERPTSEQLETEIEQTRAELAETVDAIGHKVSSLKTSAKQSIRPANLVQRREVRIAGAVLGAYVLLKALVRRRRRRHRSG